MNATTKPGFTITRTFDAPRDLVWRAWTQPEHLTHWFHPAGLRAPLEGITFDAVEGAEYEYTMVHDETGESYTQGGRFIEVREPERLVFTWGAPHDPDSHALITVELREDGDRTAMTFDLRGFDGQPGDSLVYDGWDSALDLLEQHLVG